MSKTRILIVDDDEDIREALGDRLEAMGYEVRAAEDGEAGIVEVRRGFPDLLLLDIRMPRLDGFGVLEVLRDVAPDLVTVIMTAHGSVESAVKAMQLGAYDFLEKPFDADRVEVVIRKALSAASLRRERDALVEEAQERAPKLVGASPAVQRVVEMARRAARSEATVLILGESGTGKEVLARQIHDWSERREGPFVAVNCAALPDQLLESALFGHERGAFTGATQQKKGKFEMARGGTILLDEIAELKPELQVKLLRVLEERVFERLGGSVAIEADARVMAATNRDPKEATESGRLREDLFYRLNVVSFTLPPLRDRLDDVPALAAHFLDHYSRAAKRRYDGITPEAMVRLKNYAWPGNVRELANAIERAVVLGLSDRISSEDLPAHIVEGADSGPGISAITDLPFHAAVEAYKRRLIAETLLRTNGNHAQAAELLGLQRTYLARLITNLGLRAQTGRTQA